MLALVIVRHQRLATDCTCNLLQSLRRHLHCSKRARTHGIRPHDGADPGDHVVLAHPAENADGFVLVERRETADYLEGLFDQRKAVLPAIDERELDWVRCHCPILVARAVKKIPEGFCAGISAFLAKVAVS